MTANSPSATNKTENQNGSPKKVSSQPIMKALKTTGNVIATNKCFENIIPTHAKAVAIVPNGTSRTAVGEKQLAIRHPNVKPIEYFLLKKHRSTNISENLN